MLCAVVQGAWAQIGFGGGTGPEDSPYRISSEDDWKKLVSNINNGKYDGYKGKYFELTKNITLKEKRTKGSSAVMMGIDGEGKDNTRFCGTFDGNGFTITLDIIDNCPEDYTAPFRFLKNGTIKNLNVSGKVNKTSPMKMQLASAPSSEPLRPMAPAGSSTYRDDR